MNEESQESGLPGQFDEGATDTKPVIVAIGASAGGVQALQAFIGALPEKSGAAFVVVVHLDPEKRSELSNILGLRTRMPVVQVEDNEKLKADHVYVIPPDRRLQLVDHEISAVGFDEPRGPRPPLHMFFRLLPRRLGRGVAVFLCGGGGGGGPRAG